MKGAFVNRNQLVAKWADLERRLRERPEQLRAAIAASEHHLAELDCETSAALAAGTESALEEIVQVRGRIVGLRAELEAHDLRAAQARVALAAEIRPDVEAALAAHEYDVAEAAGRFDAARESVRVTADDLDRVRRDDGGLGGVRAAIVQAPVLLQRALARQGNKPAYRQDHPVPVYGLAETPNAGVSAGQAVAIDRTSRGLTPHPGGKN
jgi:hypothetical protein